MIPTLNAAELLGRCLRSIHEQVFNRSRIEILIVDGGSNDNTLEIAERFQCRILENPLKLAEPGVKIGIDQAFFDTTIVLAADNELPKDTWLGDLHESLLRTGARAAFTHIEVSQDDPPFCRYFARLHADPFNWFVFKEYADPRMFSKLYRTINIGDAFEVYDFSDGPLPLIAMAQGFVVRGEVTSSSDAIQDDILPVWDYIESGETLLYYHGGIYHHTLDGFIDFLSKYRKRVISGLGSRAQSLRVRNKRLSSRQHARQMLFFPYAFSIILPLSYGIRRWKEDGDLAWLYHPVACFGEATLIIFSITEVVVRSSFRKFGIMFK